MQPCGASIFSSEEGPTYEYKKDKNGNYVKVGNKIDYLLDKDGNVIDFTEVKYSSGGNNRTYGEFTMLPSPALIDVTGDIVFGFFAPVRLAVLKAVAYLSRAVKVGSAAGRVYKSTDQLIRAAGKLNKGKSGYIGTVRGNAKQIHQSLVNGGQHVKGNLYKMPNGNYIKLYPSKSTGLPTIHINKGDQIYKIRIQSP